MRIQNITKHIKKIKDIWVAPGQIINIELTKDEQLKYKENIKILDNESYSAVVKEEVSEVIEKKPKKSKYKKEESPEILEEVE